MPSTATGTVAVAEGDVCAEAPVGLREPGGRGVDVEVIRRILGHSTPDGEVPFAVAVIIAGCARID